ncbi:MAG: hypothetical protein Q8Q89_00945 [bacterium]|nr:hypothetical protein [bacterium]
MTTEALVKPANIQEQLLGKISEMRQNNLTAKQKQDIKGCTNTARTGFKKLTWRYFGISETQIQEFSDQEVEALFILVFERAQKASIYMKILGYGIPLIGWLIILNESESIALTNSTRKLKSMLRNSFNPAKLMRDQA